MFSEIKIKREDIIEQINEKLDDICIEDELILDIEEDLLNTLTKREREVFAQKAAILKLISSLQEDM